MAIVSFLVSKVAFFVYTLLFYFWSYFTWMMRKWENIQVQQPLYYAFKESKKKKKYSVE